MKQLYIVLTLLLLPVALRAQRPGGAGTNVVVPPGGGGTPPPAAYSCFEKLSTYQLRADSVLQALDKSQVPTGVLYDRTAGMAYLDLFNQAHNDLDTSSVAHFLQAYSELRAATYNEPGTQPCRQLLADNAGYQQRTAGVVVLGALRYRFSTLDTLAARDNLLRWDYQSPLPRVYDVAGRPRSPYLLHEVAVAAALADSSNSGTVSFRLDPGSIFTNT